MMLIESSGCVLVVTCRLEFEEQTDDLDDMTKANAGVALLEREQEEEAALLIQAVVRGRQVRAKAQTKTVSGEEIDHETQVVDDNDDKEEEEEEQQQLQNQQTPTRE